MQTSFENGGKMRYTRRRNTRFKHDLLTCFFFKLIILYCLFKIYNSIKILIHRKYNFSNSIKYLCKINFIHNKKKCIKNLNIFFIHKMYYDSVSIAVKWNLNHFLILNSF